ncbi:MAG: hypothetical protein ACRDGM_05420, partial [bacterium]
DQTIVVADGKIAAMGDATAVKIPDGAKVLDLAGYTVIPGLVGMQSSRRADWLACARSVADPHRGERCADGHSGKK